jgi:hypothetical protein
MPCFHHQLWIEWFPIKSDQLAQLSSQKGSNKPKCMSQNREKEEKVEQVKVTEIILAEVMQVTLLVEVKVTTWVTEARVIIPEMAVKVTTRRKVVNIQVEVKPAKVSTLGAAIQVTVEVAKANIQRAVKAAEATIREAKAVEVTTQGAKAADATIRGAKAVDTLAVSAAEATTRGAKAAVVDTLTIANKGASTREVAREADIPEKGAIVVYLQGMVASREKKVWGAIANTREIANTLMTLEAEASILAVVALAVMLAKARVSILLMARFQEKVSSPSMKTS